MVAQHYRWDFIGLSTDVKPTPATSEKVVDGSTFYCSDNSKLYVFYKDQWYEKTVTGGGTTYTAGDGIVISEGTISADLAQTTGDSTTKIMSQDAVTQALASAGGSAITILDENDYNYPTDNPTTIVFGTFEAGLYRVKDDTIAVNDGEAQSKYKSSYLYIVTEANSQGWKYVYILHPSANVASNTYKISIARYIASTGQYNSISGKILSTDWVVDDLTHNGYITEPLSANQGYVLKGLIDALDARITALGG